MSQFIKMGEISIEERYKLRQFLQEKEQRTTECNALYEQDRDQYEEAKKKLCEVENEIKEWSKKIIVDHKIEIIPGAKIQINFESGDILAVLPEDI